MIFVKLLQLEISVEIGLQLVCCMLENVYAAIFVQKLPSLQL